MNSSNQPPNPEDVRAEEKSELKKSSDSTYALLANKGIFDVHEASKGVMSPVVNNNNIDPLMVRESKHQTTQVDPRDNYSINLMWLNKGLNAKNKYMFPAKDEAEIVEQLLNKALLWKNANPDADVNIWYDGDAATNEQLAETQALLTKISPNIKFRNVREIDIVKRNPDFFSLEVPVYTRVDVMKLIICIETLEKDRKSATIFSDFPIGDKRENKDRMGKDELFKPEVMETLNKCGILLGEDPMRIENQFFQVLNNPKTILALKIMVDANLCRLTEMLNIYYKNKQDVENDPKYWRNPHKKIIYNMMHNFGSSFHFLGLMEQLPNLLRYLFDPTQNPIKINARFFQDNIPNDEWVAYDPSVHGHLPFGNFFHDHDYYYVTDESNLSKNVFVRDVTTMESGDFSGMTRNDLGARHGHDHQLEILELNRLKEIKPVNGKAFEHVLYNENLQHPRPRSLHK